MLGRRGRRNRTVSSRGRQCVIDNTTECIGCGSCEVRRGDVSVGLSQNGELVVREGYAVSETSSFGPDDNW